MGTPLQLTINPQPQAPQAQAPTTFMSGENGAPSFKDFLDMINPLQHIPVISSIYRSMTGGTISNASKFAGDALYGGPLGFASSLFDSILKTQTGAGVGENIMAAVEGKPVPAMQNNGTSQTSATQMASAQDSLSPYQLKNYNAYTALSPALAPLLPKQNAVA